MVGRKPPNCTCNAGVYRKGNSNYVSMRRKILAVLCGNKLYRQWAALTRKQLRNWRLATIATVSLMFNAVVYSTTAVFPDIWTLRRTLVQGTLGVYYLKRIPWLVVFSPSGTNAPELNPSSFQQISTWKPKTLELETSTRKHGIRRFRMPSAQLNRTSGSLAAKTA